MVAKLPTTTPHTHLVVTQGQAAHTALEMKYEVQEAQG